MIRRIEVRDLPALKSLEDGYAWKFGPDFMEGLVFVDAEDRPVLFAGAWRRAEVHLAGDAAWGSAGERHAALMQLHGEMEASLKRQEVGAVVAWFEGMRSFGRRLKRMGWAMCDRTMWFRRIG